MGHPKATPDLLALPPISFERFLGHHYLSPKICSSIACRCITTVGQELTFVLNVPEVTEVTIIYLMSYENIGNCVAFFDSMESPSFTLSGVIIRRCICERTWGRVQEHPGSSSSSSR